MADYELTNDDKTVIKFVDKNILPIANEVTNFYSHWTKSDEEDHLQKAFLYESRQQGVLLTREVAITQYYKDLAFTEKELDFFIFIKYILRFLKYHSFLQLELYPLSHLFP